MQKCNLSLPGKEMVLKTYFFIGKFTELDATDVLGLRCIEPEKEAAIKRCPNNLSVLQVGFLQNSCSVPCGRNPRWNPFLVKLQASCL